MWTFVATFVLTYALTKHGASLRWWARWCWHKVKGDHRRARMR